MATAASQPSWCRNESYAPTKAGQIQAGLGPGCGQMNCTEWAGGGAGRFFREADGNFFDRVLTVVPRGLGTRSLRDVRTGGLRSMEHLTSTSINPPLAASHPQLSALGKRVRVAQI